ncbi:hypothetical protein C8R44DRAFT_886545 [Mycena epipterygia]|nr:hypothetical protein C8R44DRAFT_886545 [Mycena epipterygia]
MYSTSSTIPTVQRTTVPAAVANITPASTSTSVGAIPVNHNGPQCCHCGWRGGEHAYFKLPLQVIVGSSSDLAYNRL